MSYNIIHHKGEAKKTTLPDNTVVTRQEQFWIPEWNCFIRVAPYDNHFIYHIPDVAKQGSAYQCTCGSVAVVVPPGPGGLMVCYFDATYGFHQTTVINTRERDKYRGQKVEIVHGKRTRLK